MLSCLYLVDGGGSTFDAQEDLWQVLGFVVGDSPLEKLWFVSWSFNGSFFCLGCLITFNWLWFGNNFAFREFFPLKGILIDNFWLISKLEANDCLDLSDVLLNVEELIHESKLKLILLL